jgi:HK97 family phage portal protein
MGWKNYVLPPVFHKKASEIHRAVIKMLGLTPIWSKRNYETFAKEGYNANVWVYRCVQAIAQGVAGVPWMLYMVDSKGERKEILVHDLLKLLNTPNEFMSRYELFEAYAAYALIAGNSYLDMVGPSDKAKPKELWPLRPDRMQIVPHSTEFIAGYVYSVNGDNVPLDKSRIAHLRIFNPIDDLFGLSQIEVAGRGIDNDNAANAWNNSLLNNGARPMGALVTDDVLTSSQFDNLKNEIDKNVKGAKNAGKPMLLEGGLKWQEMGLNPKDMEFINAKKISILEICASFGVPPEIVGYGESKTYANYAEARKALYEDAVIPLLTKIKDKLNATLVKKFGDNLVLEPNLDAIEALQENRDSIYKRAIEAYNGGIIKLNEARSETGYEDVAGGDQFIPTPKLAATPKPEGKQGHFFNVKAMNIETEEQKTLYWKAMENGRENYYERAIKAVENHFKDEHKSIIKAFKSGGEDAAIKAINKKGLQKVLTGIYVEVMDHFGTDLMDQFKKDAGNHMETKAPLIPLETIFNVFDKAVQKFISTTVAKKVVGITLTTEKKIRKIIKGAEKAGESIEQIAAGIDKLYLDQIIPNRSEVIARTEVISASNAGNAYAADQTGLKLNKQWLATRDERTRETHDAVDGQKRLKTEYYEVGNVQLLFPGDPEGIAETEKDLAKEVIQCRCTEIYSVVK